MDYMTVHLTLQAAHELTHFVGLVPVQADEANEPCVKHIPLTYGGWMFGHAA